MEHVPYTGASDAMRAGFHLDHRRHAARVLKGLNTEIARILRHPAVQARLASQTFEIRGGSSEELAKVIRDDADTLAKITAEAKITDQ